MVDMGGRKMNKKWVIGIVVLGIVAFTGVVLSTALFKTAPTPVCSNLATGELHTQRVNDDMQLWDEENNVIVTTEFSDIWYETKTGLFVYKYDDKYGLANDDCEIIVEPRLNSLKMYYFNDTTTLVAFNGSYYYFMDTTGERINNNKYDLVIDSGYVTAVSLYEAMVQDFNKDNIVYSFIVFKNDKKGYVNQEGKEILQTIYSDASLFDIPNELFQVRLDDDEGIMDKNGYFVLPLGDYKISVRNICNKDTWKCGVLSDEGQIVIEPIYDSVYKYLVNDQTYYVIGKNGLYNVVKPDYSLLLDFTYEYVAFEHDKIHVIKDSHHGVLDINGNVVVPPIYNVLDLYRTGIVADFEGELGIIDYNNNPLCDFGADSITYSTEGTFTVTYPNTDEETIITLE